MEPFHQMTSFVFALRSKVGCYSVNTSTFYDGKFPACDVASRSHLQATDRPRTLRFGDIANSQHNRRGRVFGAKKPIHLVGGVPVLRKFKLQMLKGTSTRVSSFDGVGTGVTAVIPRVFSTTVCRNNPHNCSGVNSSGAYVPLSPVPASSSSASYPACDKAFRSIFRRKEKRECTKPPNSFAWCRGGRRRVRRTSAESIFGAGQNACGGSVRSNSTSASICAMTDSGP